MAGPCSSLGIQVNTPVAGLMLAPAGAPGPRLKVSDCAGRSESEADAVKLSRLPSLIDWFPIGASTGAVFTSLTIMAMVWEAPSAGEPLSVTRIVTRLLLGPCASDGVQVKMPVAGSMLAPCGAPDARL